MDMAASCRAEVQRLHAFFVVWFNDDAERPRVPFAHVDDVLHPRFSMVLPSGETLGREVVLEQIRAAHASAAGGPRVGIEIAEHVTLAADQGTALVGYQERQSTGGVLRNARTSTAYFVRAAHAPHGVQWYRLHETLLTSG